LLGLYSKNCIKPLEESLFAGNLSLHDFLSGLQAKTFTYNDECDDANSLPSFFNINTPQDYSKLIVGGPGGVHPFPGRRQVI
jgi:molybdopterin-guanine dinucleotide biosynthesis protein A